MTDTTSPLPDQRVSVVDRFRRWNPVWWKWFKPLLDTVNSTSEEVTAVQADITNVESYYAVYVNSNGRIIGSVQLSKTVPAGSATPTSEFGVLADRFIIVHPSSNGTTIQAFVVGSVNGFSTVGINGNLIVDGTIVANAIAAGAITAAKLNVGTLSAITANLGTVTAGRIQNAAGTSYWDLSTGVFQITS